MVERICNPEPECSLREEFVFLTQDIELRITVQKSGRDELIENTDDEGRQYSKDNIVERERP